MIDFLNEQWWFAISLLALLFLANSYLYRLSKRFYEAHARQHIVFSADDVSGEQKEVKENHLVSSKNVYPFLVIALLVLARLLYGRELFEFIYGAFLLVLIHNTLRHLEIIFIYLDMSKPNRVMGQIVYSHPLIQKMSSVNFFNQSIIFGIVAFATMRLFFWGGALYCLFLGFREFANAKKPLLVK